MAPDPTPRERPLRAAPRTGSTAVMEPDEEVIDLRDASTASEPAEPSVEAARLAASRPSAELPRLSRRADLLDRLRNLGGRGGSSRGASVRQLVEGAALCLVGIGLLLGWVVHVSWTPLLDLCLVLIGAVLVIQARSSTPSRPLIALGVLLAIVSAATWRAGVTLDGGFGRRTETPSAAQATPHEYRLGTGELTIDLRGSALSPTPLAVDAEVGVGRIVVRVPDHAIVRTNAVAGAGHVLVFDRRNLGPGLDEASANPAFSTNEIRLDLKVGLGSVEVRRG